MDFEQGSAHSAPSRSVKRRASKACNLCRTKKVKCSVVHSGVPCYNCCLMQATCTVSAYRRLRRPRKHPNEAQAGTSVDDDADGRSSRAEEKSSPLEKFLADPPQSLDFHLGDYVPEQTNSNGSQHAQIERTSHASQKVATVDKERILSEGHAMSETPPVETLRGELASNVEDAPLPHYIRPVPSTLDMDDIQFLKKKGALTIPRTELVNECLRRYVEYVDPFMPILNLQDFLSCITAENGFSQISLLLFHAVMYAAAVFVDMRLLNAEGYKTRKAARTALFQKAKLLYEFEYDSDRVTILQSLLLMTYYYDSPEDQKGAWYWMGVSLSCASSLGLQSRSAWLKQDLKIRSLRKRLWWCCYMRDKLIAISMRRPSRIKDSDFDTEMLQMNDFDLKNFSPGVLEIIGDWWVKNGQALRFSLAEMCVEKIKLCTCIDHLLNTQYSVQSELNELDTHTNMMLKSKPWNSDGTLVMRCEEELEGFREMLPNSCRLHVPEMLENENDPSGGILFSHAAILDMLYFTASIGLHRPQILSTPHLGLDGQSSWQTSHQRIKTAAVRITRTVEDLSERDLVRFLPPVGVTVAMAAVIIHLLDVKSCNPGSQQVSESRFRVCLHVLNQLSDMYASAAYGLAFVETVLKRLGFKPLLETQLIRDSEFDLFRSTGQVPDSLGFLNDGVFRHTINCDIETFIDWDAMINDYVDS